MLDGPDLTPLLYREKNRQAEIKELTSQGKIPWAIELEKNPKLMNEGRSFLMGDVAAMINDIKPAKQIVDEMVAEAVERLKAAGSLVNKAKL